MIAGRVNKNDQIDPVRIVAAILGPLVCWLPARTDPGAGARIGAGGGPSRSPVQKVDSDVLIFFFNKLIKIFNNYNSLCISGLRKIGV